MANTVQRRITGDIVSHGTIFKANRDDYGRTLPTIVDAPEGATFGEAVDAPSAASAPALDQAAFDAAVAREVAARLARVPLQPAPQATPLDGSAVAPVEAAEPGSVPPTIRPDGSAVALGVTAEAGGPQASDAKPDTAESPDYVGMNRDELIALAQQRKLNVVGSGQHGRILVKDLEDALRAYDAEQAAKAAGATESGDKA